MADVPALRCPGCKKKFKTKADVRGKRIRCPFCTESFIVPMDDDELEVQEEAEVPAKAEATPDDAPIPIEDDDAPIPIQGVPKPAKAKAKAKPEEDEPIPLKAAEEQEGDDPYAVTHLDLAPRCPNCAHEMPNATAVVCLNCGYNTLTREWGKTEKTIGISFGRHMAHLLPGLLALFFLILYIVLQLIYIYYVPFWAAGKSWIDWTDHESLRMWSTTVGMGLVFALGRYCYGRFFVRPLPEELELE